jgi:hypothetical protein
VSEWIKKSVINCEGISKIVNKNNKMGNCCAADTVNSNDVNMEKGAKSGDMIN